MSGVSRFLPPPSPLPPPPPPRRPIVSGRTMARTMPATRRSPRQASKAWRTRRARLARYKVRSASRAAASSPSGARSRRAAWASAASGIGLPDARERARWRYEGRAGERVWVEPGGGLWRRGDRSSTGDDGVAVPLAWPFEGMAGELAEL